MSDSTSVSQAESVETEKKKKSYLDGCTRTVERFKFKVFPDTEVQLALVSLFDR